MLNLKETQADHALASGTSGFRRLFTTCTSKDRTDHVSSFRLFTIQPNPNISPVLLRQVGLIGHKVAADLQAAGFKGVLTNALYDTWWHGGFRTAPYFHNSIGILSEAASARLMTPTTVTSRTTRALHHTRHAQRDGSGHQLSRSVAGWHVASARHHGHGDDRGSRRYSRWPQNFVATTCGTSMNSAKKAVDAPIKPDEPLAYLIPAGQARDETVAKTDRKPRRPGHRGLPARSASCTSRMDHKSCNEQIHQPKNSALIAPSSTSQRRSEVPLGSYIVFLTQPQRANVLALFEPQIYPNRLTAQGEAERPYDVAGWTLAVANGC